MNDLLFYALIIALAYYLLTQQQKQIKPITQTNSTQTETLVNADEQALASTLDTLIINIQQLNKQLK
jgi:hypothetical protein